MAPMLELDRVVVGYGDGPPVLREVSIAVGSGRMLAVTGSSGADKTTLLRTTAGQLRPTAGAVTVGGELLRDRDHAVARRIVLIPQHNGLATVLTAGENLQVVLVANGVAAEDARRRGAESLERVGLTGHAEQLVEELSGGQQQRTAIARGLALRGDVLLADEVTPAGWPSRTGGRGRRPVPPGRRSRCAAPQTGSDWPWSRRCPEVGAVTIRDGRVGSEGRNGKEFAVIAGDGTVQLPPEVLDSFGPGTLLAVEHVDGKVTLVADEHGTQR